MPGVLTSSESTHYPDEALEGERRRNCGQLSKAGDPVLMAIVPDGYEAAYCSIVCLRKDQKGGES